MAQQTLGTWLPGRKPAWSDLFVAVVVAAWLGFRLASGDPVLWPWAAAGFVAFALAIGPVAASSVGRHVGDWFRSIGVAGRALAIVAFAAAVAVARTVLEVPWDGIASFAVGGMVAVIVAVAVRTAWWLATRD